MSNSSAVPTLTYTTSGISAPTEDNILDGVLTDYDSACGGNLNTTDTTTPQGQLAASETAVIAEKNTELLYLANMFDPDTAEGIWQDAIAKFYFLTRKAATATTVTCTLGGAVNTTIPAGVMAKDTSGNIYTLNEAVTIGSDGTIAGTTWTNADTGAIACPAGTLTKVYSSGVTGWDSITNPTAGTIGRAVETRAEFEYRRKNSVAVNGKGSMPAIQAAVFGVTGVDDCYCYENVTGNTVTVGATNFVMNPHSIVVSVAGSATAAAVCAAIFSKKGDGCSMMGNTSATVEDTSNYNTPYPSYTYRYEATSNLPIHFIVTILSSSDLPANYVALIKAAIVARFNGTDSLGTPERIAATVLASRYYTAVTGISTSILLSSVTVSKDGTTYAASVIGGVDQYPTISADNISVVVNA